MNLNVLFRSVTLLLGSTMTIMAGATISPALPQILLAYSDIENADLLVRLILTVPALFIGLFAPFMGYLLDSWGRKPVLIGATFLYAVAGSSGYYLNSLEGLLAGRALLGVAVAGIMSGFTTLIGDYFQGKSLARFMGWHGAFMSFGGVVFLLVGGWMADIGWRFPFSIYLIALAIMMLVVVFIEEPVRESGNSAFEQPKLPLRKMFLCYSLAFIVMTLGYLIPVQLAFFLTNLESISGAKIGMIMAACTLASAIASIFYSRISNALSSFVVFFISYLLMGAGFLLLSFSANSVHVLGSILITGLGFGLWVPCMNVWLVSGVTPSIRGKVVGGFTTFFFLGQFFTPIFSHPITEWKGVTSTFTIAACILLTFSVVYFIAMFQTGAAKSISR